MAKKYAQVGKMQRELENVRAENMRKSQIVKAKKELIDQRHMSKVLVQAFRQSVEQVTAEKFTRKQGCKSEASLMEKKPAQQTGALNNADKKRILETFVENDDALG